MTIEQKEIFDARITSVNKDDKAKFGQMNVNQMICHCTDQIRMAFGEIKGLYRENIDMVQLREKMARGESLPTVDGLNQASGQGTKSTDLESDKLTLIRYIERFNESSSDYSFHFHPFLGDMDKVKWDRLIIYHLNHHLEQFGR